MDTSPTGGLPSGGEGGAVLRRDGGLTLSLSPTEAARALGMSVRTVYYLANSGELPMVKISRMTRFLVADLEAFLQTKRVVGNSSPTPRPVEKSREGPLWYVPAVHR